VKRFLLIILLAGFASLIPLAINHRGFAADSNLTSMRIPAPEFPAPASEFSSDLPGAGPGSQQSGPAAPRGSSPGGPQPDFPGSPDTSDGVTWINSKPLTLRGLRGKVVMIDFWDYTCINCIRTFPFNKKLWDRYKSDGLVLIGVDDAEFSSAAPVDRAREAVKRFELPYPVVVDYHYQIWDAYNNQFWPNIFLIDGNGYIRFNHEGEGGDEDIERAVQTLLKEANPSLTFPASYSIATDVNVSASECGGGVTPEMYVGDWGGRGTLANPEGYHDQKTLDYAPLDSVEDGRVILAGRWETQREGMVYRGKHKGEDPGPDRATMKYHARELYAVMNPARGRTTGLYIRQDGKDLTNSNKGADVKIDHQGHSYLEVSEPRMYYLVQNPEFGSHRVDLYPAADGLMINSFTFGNSCQTKFNHL
jgi:thiol-disulfide isomerase/thioredoxin